ncbi:MAG: J domain-containing protein [Rhodospirillales bacterium]
MPDSVKVNDRLSGKTSYTVPCSTTFRDRVEALAEAKGGNVADLARSVVMMIEPDLIRAYPDPGGPGRDDRETVTLRSGAQAGRPWRRKPRLQVRMAPGLDGVFIRRALALALDLADGHARLEPAGKAFSKRTASETDKEIQGLRGQIAEQKAEAERLRAAIESLAFEPLPRGVETRSDALFVFGFAPGSRPDRNAIRRRFRQLATIHHPDGEMGSHQRMSQLNAAMEYLRGR